MISASQFCLPIPNFTRRLIFFTSGFLAIIMAIITFGAGYVLFSGLICPHKEGFVASLIMKDDTYICNYRMLNSTTVTIRNVYTSGEYLTLFIMHGLG